MERGYLYTIGGTSPELKYWTRKEEALPSVDWGPEQLPLKEKLLRPNCSEPQCMSTEISRQWLLKTDACLAALLSKRDLSKQRHLESMLLGDVLRQHGWETVQKMEDMGLRNCGVLYLPFEKEQRKMKVGGGAAWSVDDHLRIAFRKRADIKMKMGWGGWGWP